ncbi:hypothetical protein Dimus_008686 [Dionaea muscipula]
MDGSKKNPRRSKQRSKPLEGSSFVDDDFVSQGCDPILGDAPEYVWKKRNFKSSEILSTSDLISAIGQLWNCANTSLSRLQSKRNVNNPDRAGQADDVICYLGAHGCAVHLAHQVCSCTQQQGFKCIAVTCEPFRRSFLNAFFWRSLLKIHILSNSSLKEKGLETTRSSYYLRKVYQWMSQESFSRPKFHVTTTQENERAIQSSSSSNATTACNIVQANNDDIPSHNSSTGNDDCSVITKSEDSLSGGSEVLADTRSFLSSLHSDYFLQIREPLSEAGLSRVSKSRFYADDHVDVSSSTSTYKHSYYKTDNDDHLPENKIIECEKPETQDVPHLEIHSQKIEGLNSAETKQEHAVSGALAGVFVSLCLHPVDTIKTVVQTCRANQLSLCSVGQSIVSERGWIGLYRGITSKLASSAPISAIYTFTYEKVKGHMLPFLPEEYHSIAHCSAGCCASIATSFVFTPSERIKQQMQISSQYQNCWTAMVRIIEKGGLSSLYTGWGAILCRNIPHSVIKFYVYERLKQLVLSSQQPMSHPNTLQTLLCGGTAGCAAALFSTPFDVVKTRLQTQVPGSVSRYPSVLIALQEIRRDEGIKGLYRGLTPRLFMYISQGALFFTSYELFKGLISFRRPLQSSQPRGWSGN